MSAMGSLINRRSFRRRGAAYFLVIGASMLVAVIGVSAIAVARLQTRAVIGTNDVEEAGILAFSAMEFALRSLDDDSDWRTNLLNGVETTAYSLGNGQISWMLVDEEDGDLADSDADPVRLYGIGRVGEATRVYSVLLAPDGDALTALEAALHAQGDLIFNNATVQCDQIMSGNNNATATNSFVDSVVQVVGSYSGAVYSSTPTTGISPRMLPNSGNVFDPYLANGTSIDFNSLDSTSGSDRAMQGIVLSPTENPYGGSTNSQGIYIIDCNHKTLEIRQCRIVGTLVLLNVGANSVVSEQVHWEPAVVNYPSLMAEGSMDFDFDSSQTLNEGSPYNVSYNPPGTPYESEEDLDLADSYPTVIKGLVYVFGGVDTANSPVFDGVVVIDGVWNTDGNLDLTYSQTFLDNPPPGFRAGDKVAPSAGTWRRDVLP